LLEILIKKFFNLLSEKLKSLIKMKIKPKTKENNFEEGKTKEIVIGK